MFGLATGVAIARWASLPRWLGWAVILIGIALASPALISGSSPSPCGRQPSASSSGGAARKRSRSTSATPGPATPRSGHSDWSHCEPGSLADRGSRCRTRPRQRSTVRDRWATRRADRRLRRSPRCKNAPADARDHPVMAPYHEHWRHAVGLLEPWPTSGRRLKQLRAALALASASTRGARSYAGRLTRAQAIELVGRCPRVRVNGRAQGAFGRCPKGSESCPTSSIGHMRDFTCKAPAQRRISLRDARTRLTPSAAR